MEKTYLRFHYNKEFDKVSLLSRNNDKFNYHYQVDVYNSNFEVELSIKLKPFIVENYQIGLALGYFGASSGISEKGMFEVNFRTQLITFLAEGSRVLLNTSTGNQSESNQDSVSQDKRLFIAQVDFNGNLVQYNLVYKKNYLHRHSAISINDTHFIIYNNYETSIWDAVTKEHELNRFRI